MATTSEPTTEPATADLFDEHGDALQSCDLQFRQFGGRSRFSGRIVTVSCHQDNTLLKSVLGEPGEGRVLVVDGGASRRCSLFGGNLAVAAAANGWAGVVVHGCVRDVAELAAQPVGVRALWVFPRKSERGLHSGQAGLPVVFAGVVFREGEWLCADADGIVVLPEDPAAG